MAELPPASISDDQPIEAGEVGELKDVPFHEAEHQAETARSLARWLVVLLGAGLGVHYVLVSILAFSGREEAIKNLSTIFNAWLPVISSLLSAAATVLLYEGKEMTVASSAAARAARPMQLPLSFLLCYEVTNPACLVWPVRLYQVVRANGSGQSHRDRGEIKQR